jgi:glycerol-3-phosphate cytidylyltransferase-like family protein
MVLADGCFDPLHVGHVRYLHAASDVCLGSERLMVRVAPDAAIVSKGRAVFQCQAERVVCVRSIVVQADCSTHYDTLAEAIKILEPRVLVKGMDWYGRLPDDVLNACEFAGTAVMFTATQERTSTERLG